MPSIQKNLMIPKLDPWRNFSYTNLYNITAVNHAEVAEQADAHDSKSCSFGSVGSIPTFGTKQSQFLQSIITWAIQKLWLALVFISPSPFPGYLIHVSH